MKRELLNQDQAEAKLTDRVRGVRLVVHISCGHVLQCLRLDCGYQGRYNLLHYLRRGVRNESLYAGRRHDDSPQVPAGCCRLM